MAPSKPPLRRLSIPLQSSSTTKTVWAPDDDEAPLSAGGSLRDGETTPVGRRRKKSPFDNTGGTTTNGTVGMVGSRSERSLTTSGGGWVKGNERSLQPSPSTSSLQPQPSNSRTSSEIREDKWFPTSPSMSHQSLSNSPSFTNSQNRSTSPYYSNNSSHSSTSHLPTSNGAFTPLQTPLTPSVEVRSFKMNVPGDESWTTWVRLGVKRLRYSLSAMLGGGGGGSGGLWVRVKGGKGKRGIPYRIQLLIFILLFTIFVYILKSPYTSTPIDDRLTLSFPQIQQPILIPPPRTPRRNSRPPRTIFHPTEPPLNYSTLTDLSSYFSLPLDQIKLGVLISSPRETAEKASEIVRRLRKQSLVPERVLVVCREGEGEDVALALEESSESSDSPSNGSNTGGKEDTDEDLELQVATFGPEIESRNEALVRAGIRYLGNTNVLLIMDGHDEVPEGEDWLEHWVRGLNIAQLGGRWISGAGWGSAGECFSEVENVKELQVPKGGFVMLTEWMKGLGAFKYPNHLKTSLTAPSISSSSSWSMMGEEEPVSWFMALALKRYVGVEGAALPSKEWEEQEVAEGEQPVDRSKRCSERKPVVLRELVREVAKVPNLPSSTFGGTGRDEKLTPGAQVGKTGRMSFLAANDEEVTIWESVACGFKKRGHEVLMFVGISEDLEDPHSSHSTYDDSRLCDLERKQIEKSVVEELAEWGRVDVAFYLLGSEMEGRWERGLRARGAWFGEKARTWGSGNAGGADGRTIVVALEKDEAGWADWISSLPLEALLEWHTPQIDLAVITNDRPTSLTRLLRSLQRAHYLGDSVSITINLEQTADRQTEDLVQELDWPHGKVNIRHRIIKAGLMPAIVESWYPSSNHSYGVLLEDDVEVSPLFYSWIKFSILSFRYGTEEERYRSRRLFGVSLYQQKNIELRPERREDFDAHKLFGDLFMHPYIPYLSQIPCSWGAVYFPEIWREFHMYLALRLSEVAIDISDIVVPDIKSNRWAKSWKKYFIEMVYLRGYTMLYPNYKDFQSFSTNHLETGTHVRSPVQNERTKAQFVVPLMDIETSLLEGLPEEKMPSWKDAPVLDLWGSLVNEEEILQRGYNGIEAIGSCPTQEVMTPAMIGGKKVEEVQKQDLKERETTFNARELLCERKHRVVDYMDVVAQ